MVEVTIAYQGELRCSAVHGPSGTVLLTDAPKDNHGKGESFSPTDLVAVALGSCILTTMGIAAQMAKLDITGAKITVHKEMAASPVRRIAALTATLAIPGTFTDEQKQKLTKAALGCPVHHSLHPDVKVGVDIRWG